MKMSEIKLYNDDCINVLKNIKDKTIDLICTDIPYELENHGGTNLSYEEFLIELKKGYGKSNYVQIARLLELSDGIFYDNSYCG